MRCHRRWLPNHICFHSLRPRAVPNDVAAITTASRRRDDTAVMKAGRHGHLRQSSDIVVHIALARITIGRRYPSVIEARFGRIPEAECAVRDSLPSLVIDSRSDPLTLAAGGVIVRRRRLDVYLDEEEMMVMLMVIELGGRELKVRSPRETFPDEEGIRQR